MTEKKIIRKKGKGGRPSKFSTINTELMEKLIKKGLTDKELCDIFNITEPTFNAYKKQYPEFFKSLKDWKAEADEYIEKSLYHRAKGYSHPEDKIFNDNGKALIIPTIKHYPPDTTACIFWLKNRQPAEWRDVQRHEVSANEELMSLVIAAINKGKDES